MAMHQDDNTYPKTNINPDFIYNNQGRGSLNTGTTATPTPTLRGAIEHLEETLKQARQIAGNSDELKAVITGDSSKTSIESGQSETYNLIERVIELSDHISNEITSALTNIEQVRNTIG